MRVVIDTNVAVSGLLFGGLPGKIIDLCLSGQMIWCSSMPLKNELDRVLSKDKFGLTQEEYEALVSPIYDVMEWFHSEEVIDVIHRCPADNRVLECAVASQARCIITGDRRDLVSLGNFRGIPILQPKQFFEWSIPI
jgi:putative PIN family toxin of toxin-antitoxin system